MFPAVDERRWGFEEAEDSEYERSGGESAPAPTETLIGEDADTVVQVVVSPDADVVAVRLSPRWRQLAEPQALHNKVVAAANAATMSALARSVELADLPAAAALPEGTSTDESALTARDVRRLLDAVDAELRDFSARLSAIVDRPARVRSSGGHVQGSAQRGHVLAVDVDSAWAGRARHTEIESELLEVLQRLHEASTPREMVGGPKGAALSELMELATDPVRLMRRLGMPAGTGTTGDR